MKKIITLILVIGMYIGNANAIIHGSCGDDLTWDFNNKTGSLTIYGYGAMTDFSVAPWIMHGGKSLKSVSLPDGLTHIGSNAFAGTALVSVILPSSVKSIGENAFYDCRSLTSINIPQGVTSIGDRAFYQCRSLTTITLPNTIKNIGIYAFYKCSGLNEVHYPKGIDLYNAKFDSSVNLIAYDRKSSIEQKGHTQPFVAPKESQYSEEQQSLPTIKQSAVDTDIPVTNASSPNTFAIIFANENYKNVASVPFAKNDGTIFQKYCQKTLGIPASNIHYVENASYNDIRIQLAWLKDVCDAYEGNASVLVYYAGHGIPDEGTKSAYLLPVDGDGRYVQSAYKLDDMYQKLGAMNTKSVTVFMDACFSGSKRENGMLASARGVAIKAKSGVPQGNMVVFSAAQGDETAYPNNDEQHGIFTYYLLKKLQETKGDVTLLDLGDYITTNVRQQSIVKNGKPQTPCVIPSASLGTEWQSWKLK